MATHEPVLKKEVLEYLDPKPSENFIDCTIGEGGHAKLILEKTGPNGKVLGIDRDPSQIENCRQNLKEFSERIILANDSFENLKKIAEANNFTPVDGILMDLGFSSWQIEKSGKGFSFLRDEPLDMRYNENAKSLTAEKIVNEYAEEEIENILREYGEERYSKRISKAIADSRKRKRIGSTFGLVEAIKRGYPHAEKSRIHFATRTFQALRIAVNSELEILKSSLEQAENVLAPGGRLVVISFHSLLMFHMGNLRNLN